ncbi:MAG: TMEM165/GDT1 family protein [Alphaproteobacteria bacterium]
MLDALSLAVSVFLAEFADKTQLAVLAASMDGQRNPWVVFAAGSVALTAATGMAVLAGHWGGQALADKVPLKLVAGCLFLAIGLWTIAQHFMGK